jgi:hypothetical protein
MLARRLAALLLSLRTIIVVKRAPSTPRGPRIRKSVAVKALVTWNRLAACPVLVGILRAARVQTGANTIPTICAGSMRIQRNAMSFPSYRLTGIQNRTLRSLVRSPARMWVLDPKLRHRKGEASSVSRGAAPSPAQSRIAPRNVKTLSFLSRSGWQANSADILQKCKNAKKDVFPRRPTAPHGAVEKCGTLTRSTETS